MNDFEGFSDSFFGSGYIPDDLEPDQLEYIDLDVEACEAYNPFVFQETWKPSRAQDSKLDRFVATAGSQTGTGFKPGAFSAENVTGFCPGKYTPVFDSVDVYQKGQDSLAEHLMHATVVPDVPAAISKVMEVSEAIEEPPFSGAYLMAASVVARFSSSVSECRNRFDEVGFPALTSSFCHLFGVVDNGDDLQMSGSQEVCLSTLRLCVELCGSDRSTSAVGEAVSRWILPVCRHDFRMLHILASRLDHLASIAGSEGLFEFFKWALVFGPDTWTDGNALERVPLFCRGTLQSLRSVSLLRPASEWDVEEQANFSSACASLGLPIPVGVGSGFICDVSREVEACVEHVRKLHWLLCLAGRWLGFIPSVP